ncbi:MAG: DUF2330 domain-containing protein [Bacteroidota bacterium]
MRIPSTEGQGAGRLTRVAALVGIGMGMALATLTALPRMAWACGGLFCNSPPPDPFAPLPVAQNGENIVFAIDDDPAGGAATLTAHIQILYTGDVDKFSWVVPVDGVPAVSVGTDQLFTALASVTQPTFASTFAVDGQCLPDQYGGKGVNDGAFPGRGPSAGSGGATGSASPGPAVTVAFQGTVGPYMTAVIKSDDPTELKRWLTENGYFVADVASAIIDDYVREAKYFVALRLLNGKDVKAIQPIVLTFKGVEACVPLKLTAIAANPDMPVRLWVLADRRAVPKNFLELELDEARIDWLQGGQNYNALVAEAADEAGGNAFVAEYAGPSTVASGVLWAAGRFDLAALRAAQTPPAYVQELIKMGLAADPQTLPLLAKHVPMPPEVKAMGITDSQFYANLAMYWAQYSFPAFDLGALTDEISSVVIEPRRVAQTMVDAHSYLTRLNTFISPEEMTEDAFFILNSDLPDVSNVHTAVFRSMCGSSQFMACNAPVRMELSDGRKVWVRKGVQTGTCQFPPYDTSRLQTLPAATVAWQRDATGEGSRVVDNRAAIEAGLKTNNDAFDSGCACSLGAGGGAGTALGLGTAIAAVSVLLARRRRQRRS